MYEAGEQYTPAREKLNEIVQYYPHSDAATQAQADLQKIQGK